MASVSMPARDADYGEPRGPDGLELAVGGHIELSDAIRTFARARLVRQAEFTRRFDRLPADVALHLAGINAGLSAHHRDLPSGIELSGSMSMSLPRSSFSNRIGEILGVGLGAALDKTFDNIWNGTLQLRLSAYYRLSFGDSVVPTYDPYRGSTQYLLTEANAVWSTGTLSYRVGGGWVLSAGATVTYSETSATQFDPFLPPSRASGGNFLYGGEVGYEITSHFKVALGFSRLALGYHQESSLGPLDFPFFLADSFGWANSRVYFATCLSY